MMVGMESRTSRTRQFRALRGFALACVLASSCSSETGTAPRDSAARAGGVIWASGTFESVLARAQSEHKLVFADFTTSWCGWCKRLERDTFSDAEVMRALNERYVCVSIDAESKLGAPLAQRYKIAGFPTLLFLAPDGTVRHTIGGYVPPERFRQELDRVEAAR